MGQSVHAATHEFVPDGAHEFVECDGCSATAAAVEAADTDCSPQNYVAVSEPVTAVSLLSHFYNYSSRAPPTK